MTWGFDNVKTAAAAVGAVVAAISGGVTLSGNLGYHWFERPVLAWAPEHFSVRDGYISEGFTVVVARQKLRDDCEVTSFEVEIRDSDYIVHPMTPSLAKFSGPASDTVDMFGYKIYVPEDHAHEIALGRATLLARIKYSCPEGEQLVTYPEHENLTFTILGAEPEGQK